MAMVIIRLMVLVMVIDGNNDNADDGDNDKKV